MANRRERNQQKKREKQKQKRSEARAERRQRTASAPRGRPDPRRASTWPVADAWIDDRWHQDAATIHAGLRRAHDSGLDMAVFFSVDLSGPGLLEVTLADGATPPGVGGALQARSEQATLLSTEPEAVARLFLDAVDAAAAEGRDLPEGAEDARRLLGDLDPDLSPFTYRFGPPEDDDRPVGPIGWIVRALGIA